MSAIMRNYNNYVTKLQQLEFGFKIMVAAIAESLLEPYVYDGALFKYYVRFQIRFEVQIAGVQKSEDDPSTPNKIYC